MSRFRLPGQYGEDWDFDGDGIPYMIPSSPYPEPSTKPRLTDEEELLKIKAVNRRLPDFLDLDEIAFLLGHRRFVFKNFIKNEPLEIVYREISIQEDDGAVYIHKIPGTTRDKFKSYRIRIKQWPVEGWLSGWWTEEDQQNYVIDPEKSDKEVVQDIGRRLIAKYGNTDKPLNTTTAKKMPELKTFLDKYPGKSPVKVDEWLKEVDMPYKRGRQTKIEEYFIPSLE